MCGRFTLTTPDELIAEAFGLEQLPKLSARYNVAPSQPVAAVVAAAGRRQLALFRWGMLAPGDEERDDLLLINARAETAASKPIFRDAFQRRRCLIPADGFYEWRTGAGGTKEPLDVSLRTGGLFAFAGLWAAWKQPDGEWLRSCTIITGKPNELVRPIHDRMPLIIPGDLYKRWLDPGEVPADQVEEMLKPYAAAEMEAAGSVEQPGELREAVALALGGDPGELLADVLGRDHSRTPSSASSRRLTPGPAEP